VRRPSPKLYEMLYEMRERAHQVIKGDALASFLSVQLGYRMCVLLIPLTASVGRKKTVRGKSRPRRGSWKATELPMGSIIQESKLELRRATSNNCFTGISTRNEIDVLRDNQEPRPLPVTVCPKGYMV
jgi:hypothetical protein